MEIELNSPEKIANPTESIRRKVAPVAVIDCKEAEALFPGYIARDLGKNKKLALVTHVRSCQKCYEKIFALELTLTLAAGGLLDDNDETEDNPFDSPHTHFEERT